MEHTLSDIKVAAALMEAQKKFDPILKDTNNPFYKSKYATLDQVISATRPHLQEAGLVIIQRNIRREQEAGISTRLVHLASGEQLTSEITAPPATQTIQNIAGVLTYARRYEYLTILGLAPEDDDGNAASGKSSSESEQTQQRRPSHVQTGQWNPAGQQQKTPDTAASIKAAIPNFPATTGVQPIVATTTSAATTVAIDPNAVPTKEQFDAYVIKVTDLAKEMEESGLKAGRGVPTKAKVGQYIRKVAGVQDIKTVTLGQWDVILTEFEKLMKSADGKKKAVEIVEAANTKEGK